MYEMKRSLNSPALPDKKGMRVEDFKNLDKLATPWVPWLRPAQFLSRIQSNIVAMYNKKQHFSYAAFVNYKGKNATMRVYSMPRKDSNTKFVLTIVIESKNDDVLTKWQQTYDWYGGWFTTHLKLLCLLDP